MERSARSRLERGREAEKEESRKGKRLLVSTLDSLILSVVFDIRVVIKLILQRLINFIKVTYATLI